MKPVDISDIKSNPQCDRSQKAESSNTLKHESLIKVAHYIK